MKLKIGLRLGVLICVSSLANGLMAQCAEGETVLEFVIDTDAWGYEMYWELTPTGAGCGSADVIARGSN